MIGSSGLKILPVDNLDEAARSVHIQACLKVLGAMTLPFQVVLQTFKDCCHLQRCSS